jgi:hypothetical protein
MNRCVALLLSLPFASLSVASACSAAPGEPIRFTLDSDRRDGDVRVSFRDESRGRDENNWSTTLAPAELAGLDLAALRAAGTRPIRFAMVREAGRLDCAGSGGSAHATGNCGFTADPGFLRLLESRGIKRPTHRDAFGLMALDVRRELIDALARARYPAPDVDQLMSLTAVGVTAHYVGELARLGYRPASLDSLVEFRAMNITPEYLGGMARAGYGAIEADDIVQLKALDITPDYVSRLAQIGYARLPAGDLVQLKALNVSPDYIAGFQRAGYAHLSADALVQLKAIGVTPEFAQQANSARGAVLPVDDLVQQKMLGRRR